MRKPAIALAGAAALTFGTAAQSAITVTSCTFQSCATANDATSSVIGFSDISVGATFDESVTFMNDVAGLYSITFGTSSPSVDVLSATFGPVGGVFTALTGPQGADTIVDEQFNLSQTFLPVGNYTFNTTGVRVGGVGSIAGTLSVVNAVPEPATWGLMLLGFGGVGFSMRRNRRRLAIAQIA